MLDAALAYAARGWRVLPLHTPQPGGGCSCRDRACPSPGKHPRTMHGLRDATTDEETIRRWWRMWPDAGVAIATGGGLAVLDVDPRNGGDAALAELEDQYGEIRTLIARTGGGGLHLYLAAPSDLRTRPGFMPGLDLKAAGGYVVAPPSLHASGRRYEWVPDYPEEPQPMPGWLLDLVQGRVRVNSNGARPPADDIIPEGRRNETLTSLAGTMRRRGMEEPEILAALREVNARRCRPPLPDDEVAAIARSVARYAPAGALSAAPTDSRTGSNVTLEDFYAYLPEHKYIFVPSRELWPAASVNARIPPVGEGEAAMKPSAWLDQHRAVEQMTWAPGAPMVVRDRLVSHGGWIERPGCSTFNLYRPPTIEYGDPDKAGPWIEHVHRLYPAEAEHIIRWLAHRVQRPGEKINHALVLGGQQGIGKDSLLEPVKAAVGPWNFIEVTPTHLLGRFNGFLKAVILRISEARDLGEVDRYTFYEHLKAYTAAPPDVLRIDEKNIREYSIFNVCGIIITTNHRTDGIYLPADDRRHFVAWSELTKDDFDSGYWNRLYRWYGDGGREHVAAYLARLDLSDFDPKAPPPKTPAFWAIVDANRAPEDSDLADALDRLGNPDAVTLSEIAAVANTDFAEWLRDRRNARQIPHRMEAAGYEAVRNEAAADGKWKVGGRRQVIYARRDLSLRDRVAAARALAEARRWTA